MSKLTAFALAGAMALALETPAWAVTANVPFTGLVTATCVLTVGTPGVISPSADFTTMSSSGGAGLPGTIAALSTGGNFKVSAIAPSAFLSAPDTGGNGVTFTTTYQGAGSTSIGDTPGATESTLAPGLTNLTINLTAAKGTGTFPAGLYAAEVVVRCE